MHRIASITAVCSDPVATSPPTAALTADSAADSAVAAADDAARRLTAWWRRLVLPHETGTVRLDTLLEDLGERLPRLLPGRIDVTIVDGSAGGSAGVVPVAHDAVEEALADLLFLVLPRGSWTHGLTLEATPAPSEERLRLTVRRRDSDLVRVGFVRCDLVQCDRCQAPIARLAELGIQVRHQAGGLEIDLPALSARDRAPALLAAA